MVYVMKVQMEVNTRLFSVIINLNQNRKQKFVPLAIIAVLKEYLAQTVVHMQFMIQMILLINILHKHNNNNKHEHDGPINNHHQMQ